MKAVAVFPHTQEGKLIDHEEPRILQPTHVKLCMLEVGICGTDKGIISFGFGTPPEGYDYLILGHESLGNAVFIFTGVPGHNASIQVDSSILMSNLVPKNQIVVGTVNAGKDAFEAAIHDLSTFTQHWPQVVRALITARYPLEAFHDPLFGEAGGIKNVISFV